MFSSYLHLGFPNSLLPSGFSTKILALITFGEEYKLKTPHFYNSYVTKYFLQCLVLTHPQTLFLSEATPLLPQLILQKFQLSYFLILTYLSVFHWFKRTQ
jgi:hypothetical protein